MTRDRENRLIWKHTHRDFKGVVNGTKCVLVLRPGEGTCSVPLESLTAKERAEKLTYAVWKEAKKR